MEEQKSQQSVIGEDIEITGSVKCASTIQLDGKLNGDLTCGGNAVIGATASIKGNISADSAIIHGTVNGNITAKDRIDLKATAKLNGDIRSRRLSVEDGATLVGKSEVNPTGPGARAGAPEAKQSESDNAGEEPDAKGGKGGFGRK